MTVRYTSADEDSGRWERFTFRPGDIVISTRSKSGTTWVQMICALLIHGTPDLPQPLSTLSPWWDRTTVPIEELVTRLEAQPHRRVVKTHTPLDGVPVDDRATYVVVGRHPLDSAVSLYHQGDNIDRRRLRQLTGAPEPDGPEPARPDLHTWLLRWIDSDAPPAEALDGLRGVLFHATDAWRRRDRPGVVLLHYDDLQRDLDGEMRRLAARLGIGVDEAVWPTLVDAASFASMRSRVDEVSPNADGVLKDSRAFFRRGRSGAGTEVLGPDDLVRYGDRVRSLAPADVVEWLHHGVAGCLAAPDQPVHAEVLRHRAQARDERHRDQQ